MPHYTEEMYVMRSRNVQISASDRTIEVYEPFSCVFAVGVSADSIGRPAPSTILSPLVAWRPEMEVAAEPRFCQRSGHAPDNILALCTAEDWSSYPAGMGKWYSSVGYYVDPMGVR